MGTFPKRDPKADSFLTNNSITDCDSANNASTPVNGDPLEQSGGRWSDGNVCYARYQHALPPNRHSCYLGGVVDNDGPILSTASSRHPGGVQMLSADGTVRFVKESVQGNIWGALGSVAGGEVVGSGDF